MASRHATRAAVALLLVMSIAAPHALGGSATDPEVEDACESRDDPTLPAPLDIVKAWVGPFLSKEVIVQVCGDLEQGELTPLFGGHEEAATARYGWQFRFKDLFGDTWNVRSYVQIGGLKQCVSKNEGESTWKERPGGGSSVYPKMDFEKNRIIMHFPPEKAPALTRLNWRELHAVSVIHNNTDEFVDISPGVPPGIGIDTTVNCLSSYQVVDRAPDEGFGRDVN